MSSRHFILLTEAPIDPIGTPTMAIGCSLATIGIPINPKESPADIKECSVVPIRYSTSSIEIPAMAIGGSLTTIEIQIIPKESTTDPIGYPTRAEGYSTGSTGHLFNSHRSLNRILSPLVP